LKVPATNRLAEIYCERPYIARKFLGHPCPETGRFSKKNREAIEHERAITERD
jgi:hypothetical protein